MTNSAVIKGHWQSEFLLPYLTILRGWLHGVVPARAEFSPGNRAENIDDYMDILNAIQPGQISCGDTHLRTKFKNKNMALTISVQKLAVLVFIQFGLLLTVIIQCYGIAMLYQLLHAKRNLLLCAYLCAQKRRMARKLKRLKIHRLCRKKRSVWVTKRPTNGGIMLFIEMLLPLFRRKTFE